MGSGKQLLGEKKVLVVDDVASARKIVLKLLASLGFTQTEQAANGREALERIRQGDIGLIISDWNMPELDGLGLLHALRAEPATEKVPFIMITASAKRDLVVKAHELGVSDYVVKPFNAEVLAKKIDGVMQHELQPSPSSDNKTFPSSAQ